MGDKKDSHLNRILNTIRNQFIIGLIVAIPLSVTLLILLWVFNVIDSFLQPIIGLLFGYTIPGIGFIITLLLIYLTGVVSSNVAGRNFIRLGETLVYRVPLVRTLYSAVKQVVANFSGPSRNNFLKVVLVEYPRKGVVSLAFVTCETRDESGKRLLSLLVPTAPNPLSGYVIVVSEDEVMPANMRVDDAMKMIISCGAILPPETKNGTTLLNNWPPSFPKEDRIPPDRRDS